MITLAFGALGIAGSAEQDRADPPWLETFGYSPGDIHLIEIGEFVYPYISVTIGEASTMLPFDTGNMVGISVSSALFERLELATVDTYDRLDSKGDVIATLRVGQPQNVEVLDLDIGSQRIYELDHSSLSGLVGPGFLKDLRFTLDYGSRRLAISNTPLPDSINGYRGIPLVRSDRHSTLIIVEGSVNGREILLELDTGKSRSVIHPGLAAELELKPSSGGFRIGDLRIGDLSFDVPDAKPVDQTAIDPALPEPIMAGIGSDLLSQFVWTVDYAAGILWVPISR
jgi:hypothetical protein